MILFQYVALCGSILFLILVLVSVYRRKIKEAFALIWLLTGIGILLLSLFPVLLNLLALLLGIETPAFALLLCMLGGILLLLFQLTRVISAHAEKITRLTQEVTLLKEKIDNCKDKKLQ
ncbi:MAG: DUF2304 domain-containing protein [Lentisphaeria bacterium]|nr:DUF2304 domain-containing protein [Lentisphaeria bacterium]